MKQVKKVLVEAVVARDYRKTTKYILGQGLEHNYVANRKEKII
jgi:hypothetical protein